MNPGEFASPINLLRLSIATAVGGLIGMTPALPDVVSAVLVGAFLFAGPGSVILSWFPEIPAYARLILIPTAGFAVCAISLTALVTYGIYAPNTMLAAFATTTIAVAVFKLRLLTTPRGEQ
ncbi:MAG: hypothetical protein LLG14_25930 [Nocardiaceae bacterium]|nr:hypothetical protein [Nocardiaceae bacterium]